MTTLNIRVPEDLAGRLISLSEQTGRTKSYYVRAALEEKLQDMEDYFLAMESLENVHTGKSKTWTQEELEAEIDLQN